LIIDIDNKETNGHVTYNVGDIYIDIHDSHGVIVSITARNGQKNPLPCFMIFMDEDIARIPLGSFSKWKHGGRITEQQWKTESKSWLSLVAKKELTAWIVLQRQCMYSSSA
jgi:hypothetical protein